MQISQLLEYVCISLRTTVVHNTVQNSSNFFLSSRQSILHRCCLPEGRNCAYIALQRKARETVREREIKTLKVGDRHILGSRDGDAWRMEVGGAGVNEYCGRSSCDFRVRIIFYRTDALCLMTTKTFVTVTFVLYLCHSTRLADSVHLQYTLLSSEYLLNILHLQCFDAIGLAAGRASGS